MNRPGTCSICSRSDASDIDRALAGSGTSWRAVARRYGLGRAAVTRHAHKHLGSRLRRAAEARASGSDPALLDKLLEYNRVTKGILARALTAGDLKSALKAVARAERQLELEGKLLGLLRDNGGATINVTVVDDAAATRMAKVFLQRRGVLAGDAEPREVATTDSENEEEP